MDASEPLDRPSGLVAQLTRWPEGHTRPPIGIMSDDKIAAIAELVEIGPRWLGFDKQFGAAAAAVAIIWLKARAARGSWLVVAAAAVVV